jgi:hypothetical protein
MSIVSSDFNPESVLRSVATELRYNSEDLSVFWDETADPRIRYTVKGRINGMAVVVYRNQESADADKNQQIIDSLLRGAFFEQKKVDPWMVNAVAKVCKLEDLTSYLTVLSREGWAMTDLEAEPSREVKTISQLKRYQLRLLAMWLVDPLAALGVIHKGDLSIVLAVLIEQCSYDEAALAKAIRSISGMGGLGISATTSEGYIIEAENQEARDYLLALYESSPVLGSAVWPLSR